MKVLIIGGVAGGASAAARLRRLDENAEIIMFERGEYISFANCGLPYYIGETIKEKSALTLQTPKSFKSRFNIDVRVFNEVIKIDRENKQVVVKDHLNGNEYSESYDKLIMSMGAKPIKPPIPGIESDRIFTLRNIPDTYKIKDYIDNQKPNSAIVVGGGYIGIEMAENLVDAGLDVIIVEMLDQVISPIDIDMAQEVQKHIESQGVRLILSNGVKSISETDQGLNVTLNQGEISADMLIMSVGVQPESSLAKEAGIVLNPRGAVVTDGNMLTNDPDIYAVGDVVEVTEYVTGEKANIALAGPANKQGRIAADNICGIESAYDGSQGSSILKVFDLTVAATGINEKTAKRLNLNYEKVFTYSPSHASYYPGARNMSVKTIYDKDSGKILGAQLVGYEGVDKRCDVIAAAIRFGAKASDLTRLDLCYAPPFSSAKDPVNMAGYVIENIMSGKVKIFHWHDIENLPKDSTIILDVRTKLEFQNGSIPNSVNIPLDDLRGRLSEIDKSKKIYVTCQIGLRGYIACRILSQNGFDCYNFSGGYRLYKIIFEKTQLLPINKNNDKPSDKSEYISPENGGDTIKIDACGLQCPGPIVKLSEAIKNAKINDIIEISTTDPAFASDIEGFCRRTGNKLLNITNNKGTVIVKLQVGDLNQPVCGVSGNNNKNIIVFSGDLDKAIAAFIIANASAAMGRKVSMFFTFWGLNILRKPGKVNVAKDFMSKMFGKMMPKGSMKLPLSNMNMGGMGPALIRDIMKKKNISSLEDLIKLAQENGVELIACSMSMDVMGLQLEELIDGVKPGGAAAMIAFAEESDMSLFI